MGWDDMGLAVAPRRARLKPGVGRTPLQGRQEAALCSARMIRRLAPLLALLALAACSKPATAPPKTLTFSIVSTEASQTQMANGGRS